jgi:hypothetical protein
MHIDNAYPRIRETRRPIPSAPETGAMNTAVPPSARRGRATTVEIRFRIDQ